LASQFEEIAKIERSRRTEAFVYTEVLIMRCIALAALCAVASITIGCSGTNVGVNAKTPALAALPTHVGTVNSSKFELGDIVAVNAKTHETWRIASAQFNPNEVAFSPAKDLSVEPVTAQFDFAFDKKVAKPVSSKVESTVASGTEIHVENYFTRGFKTPAVFVAGSRDVSRAVRAMHEKNPEAQCFLVSAVTSADRVYLKLDSAPKESVKADKYTVHVSYPQNEQLKELAKDSPAFFSLTPLKCVEQEDQQVVLAE
jgi:hypothetical protein